MSIMSRAPTKDWDDHYDQTFKKKTYEPSGYYEIGTFGNLCVHCGRPPQDHIRKTDHDRGECPREQQYIQPDRPGGSRYSSKWTPGQRNEEFWREVLVGRKIVEIEWDDKGVSALVFDNGEKILFPSVEGGRFCIRDES
jgi:hypothetical protein